MITLTRQSALMAATTKMVNTRYRLKNIYGNKGTENITITLKKQLGDLIDHYEDGEAKRLMGIDVSND